MVADNYTICYCLEYIDCKTDYMGGGGGGGGKNTI